MLDWLYEVTENQEFSSGLVLLDTEQVFMGLQNSSLTSESKISPHYSIYPLGRTSNLIEAFGSKFDFAFFCRAKQWHKTPTPHSVDKGLVNQPPHQQLNCIIRTWHLRVVPPSNYRIFRLVIEKHKIFAKKHLAHETASLNYKLAN